MAWRVAIAGVLAVGKAEEVVTATLFRLSRTEEDRLDKSLFCDLQK